jgi:hypothetical protein
MSRTRVERIQKQLSIESTIIANILERKNANSDSNLKERLSIISCECGAEILVVPDLQAMNRAIETHVAEHRKNETNGKKREITSSKIGHLLSQLSLISISERSDT